MCLFHRFIDSRSLLLYINRKKQTCSVSNWHFDCMFLFTYPLDGFIFILFFVKEPGKQQQRAKNIDRRASTYLMYIFPQIFIKKYLITYISIT